MKVKALIKYDGTVECLKVIEEAVNEMGKAKRYEVLEEDSIAVHVAVIQCINRKEIFFGINRNEWFIVFYADYKDADKLPIGSRVLSENLACCVLYNDFEVGYWLHNRPEIGYLGDYEVSTHSTYTGKRYLRYEFRQSYYPLGYE